MIELSDKTTKALKTLDDQLYTTYMTWTVFESLFGHSEARIEILNKVSPASFHIIQQIMQDNIYLMITRLLDPAKTFSNENFTIPYLSELIRNDSHDELANTIDLKHKAIQRSASGMIKLRNKRIAHADRNEIEKATYTRPSRSAIKKTLADISELLTAVHLELDGSQYAHEHVIFRGDGGSIAYWLAQGLRIDDLKKKFLSGDMTSDQLSHFFIHEFPNVEH